jgi:DNA repair ATPase RecN
MKAIITNESKEQKSLDKLFKQAQPSNPTYRIRYQEEKENLQALVDKSIIRAKLLVSYKEHFKCLHDDLGELIRKIQEVGMPLDEIIEELEDFKGCLL